MTDTNTGTETITVALNKLDRDPLNVRKTYTKEGIQEMAATIRADGYRILQNLIVRKGDKRGRFYVIAGGRRLAALDLLADLGEIAKDFAVECKVRSVEDATEISLIENTQREAMLGSVSQLSCWVRTAVMVLSDTGGTYKGRHADVRVKRSRSEARTTLEAAATPQASP